VGAREERLAENEARFREVNERVAEVATLYIETETHRAVDFTCDVVVDGLGEDLEALSSRLRELLDQDRWKTPTR
jgi:hypothetical protein